MQKLDKVALVAAAVILLGGVIFTFLGADPGKQSAQNIKDYAAKIAETEAEQSSLPRISPPDVAEEIRDHFSVDPGRKLPGWNFYRRPATYEEIPTVETIIPSLTEGVVCVVEGVRAQPSSVFLRVSGFAGSTNDGAEMAQEVLERRAEGGEWEAVGTVSGDSGDPFEIDVIKGVERGASYQFRLVSTAMSRGVDFPGGQKTQTVTSAESGLVWVPRDQEWECTQAQQGGLGAGGSIEPGRATITRLQWDWDKMEVKRKQHFAVEGDGKKIFDTDYVLMQIRTDTKPWTIALRGTGRDRLKLLLGDRAPTLEVQSWESEDSSCRGDGSGEDNSGAGGSNSNNNASSGDNSGSGRVSPSPADDDDDDGGLFGGDD